MVAKKCWRCGCFQETVNTLQASTTIGKPLASLLTEAHTLFEDVRYDCLGCEVCWPAVAQNLATELDPAVAEGGHCATQEPEAREGWPPLPGDYRVTRFQAPVAVCTLNSDQLIDSLTEANIEGLAIVGTLHTENLGIEHLIRNVLTNPHIRFLLICGEDTRKTIGHLPGQSLVSLMKNGIDEKGRIIGAKGKRPLLKNLEKPHIEAFRQQLTLIEKIGEADVDQLLTLVVEAAINNPGPFTDAPNDIHAPTIESATKPGPLVLDPKGYFVVYPDRNKQYLLLEHYSNQGVLNRVFESTSPAALYTTVIEQKLISRLDHAAYLGRELARADQALKTGEAYVQDRAPGQIEDKGSACCSTKNGCI
ncbi:Tetrahydromethanopterin S-methyltransferase subunit A homolog [hydrothermal vent metagenome]|uniref:Tetrahydromethanopterin S-methyltransferase subunit A homolog n=1 Tax=hydrothermal vent metagenome TaxID=652676 RepID=A0A3B1BDD0_9ZZZZ